MNELITVPFAVEALQVQCLRGEVSTSKAREFLAAFGGIRHTSRSGVELWLFVGQLWDVEVLTSDRNPEQCILWRAMTPG
jgi:hypothetical protein